MRWNSPPSSTSRGGFAGGGIYSGEILLVGLIMAFLVLLAAATPAGMVAFQVHGPFRRVTTKQLA
jgi:hypothetical protein